MLILGQAPSRPGALDFQPDLSMRGDRPGPGFATATLLEFYESAGAKDIEKYLDVLELLRIGLVLEHKHTHPPYSAYSSLSTRCR
jgi:hypothetical protein